MKSVRLEATKYIWTAFAVSMGLMLGGAFFGYDIGVGQIVLGIVISIAAFLSTGTVWNWGTIKLDNETLEMSEGEKAKRRQRGLDRLLDQMSDDELLDLREELRHHKFNQDGELLYQETRR